MGDCVRNCKRISVVEGSGSSTSMAVSKKRRIIGLTSSDLELGENCLCVHGFAGEDGFSGELSWRKHR